jgi:hypothetical protein
MGHEHDHRRPQQKWLSDPPAQARRYYQRET